MDGVIGLAFKRKNEVLLIKRRDVPIWVIPGGGIENGETPEEAMAREFLEETGFKVKIKRKVAVYRQNHKKDIHLFTCQILSGKPTLGPETKDIGFFDYDSIPSLSHPALKEWLDDETENSPVIIYRDVKPISNLMVLSNFFKHPTLVIRFFLTKIGIRINL